MPRDRKGSRFFISANTARLKKRPSTESRDGEVGLHLSVPREPGTEISVASSFGMTSGGFFRLTVEHEVSTLA